MRVFIVACVIALLVPVLGGCATTGGQATPESATTLPPKAGDIIAVRSGETVPFDHVMNRVAEDRVVYVGEQHNNDFQHAFEARVVRAMYARDPHLLIGMEMFQRPYQKPLTEFVAGKIDEAAMLKQTQYFRRWGWDYHYYRPILLFAREHGIPVLALNAPAEVSRQVARKGLDSLTPGERKWIAKKIDLTNKAHRKFIRSIFGHHPLPKGMDFENFYAAQCVWEDTMAESVALGLKAHPGYRMVVIAGGGHVQEGFGIPDRALSRGAKPFAILYGLTTSEELDRKDLADARADHLADYLFVTEPAPRRGPTPRLGVMIGKPDGSRGLPVTKVVPSGIADLAGVEAGDRIVAVNGSRIKTVTDLRLALTLMEPRIGTITVERAGRTYSLTFDRTWN